MLLYDACRPYDACNDDEQAEPPGGVIAKDVAECHYAADGGAGSCHVYAESPAQVDDDADNHHYQCGEYDANHIPWDVEPTHHDKAEDVGHEVQSKGYEARLAAYHVVGSVAVDLTEQEYGERRQEDGEAVDQGQHSELVAQGHDAHVGEQEEYEKCQKRDVVWRE